MGPWSHAATSPCREGQCGRSKRACTGRGGHALEPSKFRGMGPWDRGAMGPRDLDGAMRRAVRVGRPEQAGKLRPFRGPGTWGHGAMQP